MLTFPKLRQLPKSLKEHVCCVDSETSCACRVVCEKRVKRFVERLM